MVQVASPGLDQKGSHQRVANWWTIKGLLYKGGMVFQYEILQRHSDDRNDMPPVNYVIGE